MFLLHDIPSSVKQNYDDLNGKKRLSIIGFFSPRTMLTFNQNIDRVGGIIIDNQLVPLESSKKFRLWIYHALHTYIPLFEEVDIHT